MTAQHDRRQALYDTYCAVPEHQRAEIIDGTLYVLPRPAPRHANATTVLGGELNGAFQRGRGGPGGWWILFEPELQLTALEPMAPDLAGWRVERMPALPETHTSRWFRTGSARCCRDRPRPSIAARSSRSMRPMVSGTSG